MGTPGRSIATLGDKGCGPRKTDQKCRRSKSLENLVITRSERDRGGTRGRGRGIRAVRMLDERFALAVGGRENWREKPVGSRTGDRCLPRDCLAALPPRRRGMAPVVLPASWNFPSDLFRRPAAPRDAISPRASQSPSPRRRSRVQIRRRVYEISRVRGDARENER